MARKKPDKASGHQSHSTSGISMRTRGLQIADSSTPAAHPESGRRKSQRLSAVQSTSSPGPSSVERDSREPGDSSMSGSSRRVKAVAVPVSPPSTSKSGKNKSHSPSVTTDFSNEHTDRDEVDTPGTSAVPTPARSAHTRGTRKSLLGTARALETSTQAESPSAVKGKGKRTARDDQVDEDEMLAQALQQEEYESMDVDVDVSTGKGKRRHVPDSDEDESDDAVSTGNASSDSEFPLASKKKGKSAKRQKVVVSETDTSASETEDDDVLGEDSSVETGDESAETKASINKHTGKNGKPLYKKPGKPVPLRGPKLHTKAQMAGAPRHRQERMKLENTHPEIMTIWEDLADIPTITPERGPQPEYISRKLKPFQLEGVDWMRKQELTQWKGGLLGDEMGMGKTIQAVSLIMSDYPQQQPTLVVVPPVALMQWKAEIAMYTDGRLKVLIHHNSDSKVSKLTMEDILAYDVIMISYSGLESMHRKETKGWKREDGLVKQNSRIHAIDFHRIILDEAHSIKSQSTGIAKACFALNGTYRWCLSGTPVQNRISELLSLIRFLRVDKFSAYMCKACACTAMHWQQDERKRCTVCSHSGFSHVSVFTQELMNPLTEAHDAESRQEAFGKLHSLTARIMLRRVKRENTSSMELPPKDIVVHNQFFSPVEKDFAQSIMGDSQRKFSTYVSQGVVLNNFANIFSLITRMRQAADHPDLILRRQAEGSQNVAVCQICDEACEDRVRSACRHDFCRTCAKSYMSSYATLENSSGPDCPRCHVPFAIDLDQPEIEQAQDAMDDEGAKKTSIVNRVDKSNWTSSTKIEMLIYELYKLRSKKQTKKSIVFSQFTSMLDLVDWRLRRAGFNTVKLDGSMSPMQRQRSIEHFMTNVDVEVFLVSLKAGGVALNLTEASRVFIIDPWWNPAVEWQSADRAHRIGQRRPVTITRLSVEDSVESRIIQLQAKKASMVASTVDNDTVALDKLAAEDMQFLFRGN